MSRLDGSQRILCVTTDWFRKLISKWSPMVMDGFIPVPPKMAGPLLGSLLLESTFRPRTQALEADMSWKQLIPYVLLSRGPEWLWYSRPDAVGDPRLCRKMSLGWGGHVEDSDGRAEAVRRGAADQVASRYEGPMNEARARTVQAATRRELWEEAGLGPESLGALRFRGLLNDDRDGVGGVHIGLVYTCQIAPATVPVFAPDAVASWGWADGRGLRQNADTPSETVEWEGWSDLLIPAVSEWSAEPSNGVPENAASLGRVDDSAVAL